MNPCNLPDRWREMADDYERDGALVRGDSLLRRVADELEIAWREFEAEELTISQAAEESGYSEYHLRELVREEKIPGRHRNGSQGEILIRRCDTPRKPGAQRQPLSVVEDMASQILSARR